MKTVSVVMCTYNGEKFLREQLDSIVNQTYPIKEIIIQDDCSTDGTIGILKEYTARYSNIKLYINNVQKGVTLNFITALTLATGDLIAISDQDDIWHLEKIKKQKDYMDKQNAILCFSLSRPFTLENIPLNIDTRVPNSSLERLIFYPVIPGHAMLFDRKIISLLPKEFLDKRSYDGQIAITANANGKVVALNEFLTDHRRHLAAVSYIKPESNERTINNIFHYIFSGIKNYRRNLEKRCVYMSEVNLYLKEFPVKSQSLCNALLLSDLLSKGSSFSEIKAAWYCMKFRDKIFYAREKNFFIGIIRAAFWPILSCKYYTK